MTKTLLIGSTIAVAFTMLFIAGPAFAGMVPGFSAVDELDSGKVFAAGKKTILAKFNLDELTPVPRHGEVFGGYGVLTTSDSLLVVTSHNGFYDSEGQISPGVDNNLSSFSEVCLGAAFDNVLFPSCGPEWHAHLANLASAEGTDCVGNANLGGAQLQVAALTFEEPAHVDVQANMIQLTNINKGTNAYTESVSGDIMDFKMGKYAGSLVSFNLVPRGDPFPVCVEDVTPIDVKSKGFGKDKDND